MKPTKQIYSTCFIPIIMNEIHRIIKIGLSTFCLFSILSCINLTAQVDTDALFEEAKTTAYAKDYAKAIEQLEKVIELQQQHFDAKLMLARVLAWDKKYTLSLEKTASLLSEYPDNKEALELKETVEKWKDASEAEDFNEHIQLAYNLDFLMSSPVRWQFVSIEYFREIPDMPLSVRLNHTNRFDLKATQFEVEIYPKFSKRNYAFLSLAYSSSSLFADYTLAASVFHNLKDNLEVEGGFRYILFDSNTPIFAGILSLGQYTNNIWVNYRFSLIKAGQINGQTHLFRVRKYLQNEQNYLFADVTVGTTERDLQAFQTLNNLRTNTKNLKIGLRKGLSHKLYLMAAIGYELTTNSEQKKTSILSTNFALTRRF
ncbi:MAG: YaiO family outer membrane beta-barrel protein [Chitinophagales bacterium]